MNWRTSSPQLFSTSDRCSFRDWRKSTSSSSETFFFAFQKREEWTLSCCHPLSSAMLNSRSDKLSRFSSKSHQRIIDDLSTFDDSDFIWWNFYHNCFFLMSWTVEIEPRGLKLSKFFKILCKFFFEKFRILEKFSKIFCTNFRIFFLFLKVTTKSKLTKRIQKCAYSSFILRAFPKSSGNHSPQSQLSIFNCAHKTGPRLNVSLGMPSCTLWALSHVFQTCRK